MPQGVRVRVSHGAQLNPNLMKEQITESTTSEVHNSYLHDWVFHYNPYTNSWAAFPRDYYTQYWNGYDDKNILRSKHINVLVDLLHKAKGDVETIHEITRSSDII